MTCDTIHARTASSSGVLSVTSRSEVDYLERLGMVLEHAMQSGPPATVTELLRQGQGATPDIVLDWLSATYGRSHIPSQVLRSGKRNAPRPELHPLLFEWYFDSESVGFMAEAVAGFGSDILCLGTPTVAAELCRFAQAGPVALVDADAGVVERFRYLNRLNSLHVGELDTFPEGALYSVVVADPPWYLADALRWLKVARRHVRTGGAIVMPIFPELTRPTASEERDQILAAAERLGRPELFLNRLVYETPRFEEDALRALGITDVGDWRAADLLVVRDVQGPADWNDLDGVHRGLTGWRRFEIGPQVIMLREFETVARTNSVFVPIAGCPRNTLTSVSERDPRRGMIGLWTSRNRVAAVGDTAQAKAMLLDLSRETTAIPSAGGSSAHLFLRDLLFAT